MTASKKTRVMIVDRSHVLREMVSRQLNSSIKDIEITSCSCGKDALEHLSDDHYQLITTALLLDDYDGLALCRKIRESKKHRFTPVIVISSDAESRSIKEGFAAGVTDYFDKSRGYEAFADFIEDFIRSNIGMVGRVLYIEDSPSVALVIRGYLDRHGLQVTHLTHAEEAYTRLEAMRNGQSDENFDLLITDFFLQGEMTGGDLLHAVRSRLHYTRQELPVLVMTGNEDASSQAELFHAGANDFVGKPVVEEILMARVRSLLMIKQQFDALGRLADKMSELAVTDALTRVHNRTWLANQGTEFLNHIEHQPLWVLLLDIDHFKQVNDTYGHDAGDKVLTAMGKLMLEYFDDCAVARYGGEEFVVLIPHSESIVVMRQVERFRVKVEALKPANIRITISIGAVHQLPSQQESLEQLLKKADQALYLSKEEGRNRTTIFTDKGFQTPVEVIGSVLDQADLERTVML